MHLVRSPLAMLIACLIFLLNSGTGWATEATPIRAGTSYQGPLQLIAEGYGVSFELPAEWIGSLPEDSTTFFMERPEKPGLMLLLPAGESREQILSAMSKPIPMDAQTLLTPAARPELEKRYITNTFDVAGQADLGAYAIAGMFGINTGIGVIVIGHKDELAALRNTANSLYRSLGHNKPSGPKLTDSASWHDFLNGTRLEYFANWVGYREHKTLRLCHDGSFRHGIRPGVHGGLGNSALRSPEMGHWNVVDEGEQVVLQLHYREEGLHTLSLQQRGGKTLLNGQRWYVSHDKAGC